MTNLEKNNMSAIISFDYKNRNLLVVKIIAFQL